MALVCNAAGGFKLRDRHEMLIGGDPLGDGLDCLFLFGSAMNEPVEVRFDGSSLNALLIDDLS